MTRHTGTVRRMIALVLTATFAIPSAMSAAALAAPGVDTSKYHFDQAIACAERSDCIPNIWPDGAPVGNGKTEKVAVSLHACLPPDRPGNACPAFVICPGGGYGMRCEEYEGYGIAAWLNWNGIAGFVLDYRLPGGNKVVPLSDAQRAIRYVRAHAADFGVDPEKIGIIGFSAGGHLASSATVHFDSGDSNAADIVARTSCRPDFSILVYPVVTMDEGFTHAGSRDALLGPNPTPDEILYYSGEKQITAATPPTFLAHALDDKVVPIRNSQDFAAGMKELGRLVKLLELPNGGHGLNGYSGPSWDAWQVESIKWLNTEVLGKEGEVED